MFGFGKTKQETWTGVVTKTGLGHNYDEDGEQSTYYVADITRDDTGKTQHVYITAEQFNSLQIGDKVVKPSDTKKIEKQ